MSSLQFVIYSDPVAKGRPRFSTQGGFARAYTPSKTVKWETLVKTVAREHMRGDCFKMTLKPCIVYIGVYRLLPKAFKGKETHENGKIRVCDKRPDADNYAKGILDALNGIVYKDDGQVVELHVFKYYSLNPRTSVIVKEYNTDEQ